MITEKKINKQHTWVAINEPTQVEKEKLIHHYQVTDEMIGYAIDPNERARIETDRDANIFLLIFDVLSKDITASGSTEPIGIMLVNDYVLTFTRSSTEFVNTVFARHLNNALLHSKEEVAPLTIIFRTLYELSVQYFDAVNNINRQRQQIQKSMTHRISRKSISDMLGLETSLVYYLTSLRSNNALLTSMNRMQEIQMTTGQHEQLEDVIVESQQGEEMAQLATDIIERVANANSNILDSDLNNTMKFLTVFSIVLAVPSIVFGFFGQNVLVPFSHSIIGWELTILITVILILIVLLILNLNNFFKK
ncbi:magnesium transporter CorA family protein [Pediococcus inopinatus]|uniref:Magnesium transporter CorA family protein n=1 Tax=Pediococcus inopinatus TaxID=114090 RepID=A0ABZ0Q7R3_9LACO|nr:magnesium transporter CorA family protein [Pediococcus inopinatus]WPC20451.1 magnesium transporter CorA family protein [Pediococcus inopinatus]WPC22157.1 magnesium transporter CorA family protein [Pediococcus inopinatus]